MLRTKKALTMDPELAGTEPLSEDELSEARRYRLVIQWFAEDAVYNAEVPQLPGAKTHGATLAEAAEMAAEVAELWIRMAKV